MFVKKKRNLTNQSRCHHTAETNLTVCHSKQVRNLCLWHTHTHIYRDNEKGIEERGGGGSHQQTAKTEERWQGGWSWGGGWWGMEGRSDMGQLWVATSINTAKPNRHVMAVSRTSRHFQDDCARAQRAELQVKKRHHILQHHGLAGQQAA